MLLSLSINPRKQNMLFIGSFCTQMKPYSSTLPTPLSHWFGAVLFFLLSRGFVLFVFSSCFGHFFCFNNVISWFCLSLLFPDSKTVFITAKTTGLGFGCFVVINPCCQPTNQQSWFGLLFHKLSNFTPPPPPGSQASSSGVVSEE